MKKLSRTLAIILFVAAGSWWGGVAHAVVWTMPTLPPVGPTDAAVRAQGVLNGGGVTQTGSTIVNAVGSPAAPTLTTNGTAGSTSIVYACTGVDVNGNATIPSATATIATANATLTTTNSVNIICTGKTGALAFLIHKVDTSHVLGICYTTSGANCTFIDNGSVATTFTYTPNTADQTGGVSSWAPQTAGAGLFANLPACTAANAGQAFVITNSSAVAAEGQTCVGASTHTALAICLDGAVWKCF
jgi:hypothetical protein